MRSMCMKFTELFENHLVVPVYQRSYSWSLEETDQLLGDLHRSGRLVPLSSKGALYLGNIILYTKSDAANDIHELVDGQQRCVTLMLVMLALRRFDLLGELTKVCNPAKFAVHNNDAAVFKQLLEKGTCNQDCAMSQAFKMATALIQKKIDSEDTKYLETMIAGIKHAVVSVLILDEDDNAQAVLQSFNSTGRNLTEFDLIKNSSLMRGGNAATAKYNESWGALMQYCDTQGIEYTEGLRRVLSYMQIERGDGSRQRSMLHAVNQYYTLNQPYENTRDSEPAQTLEHGISQYLHRQQLFEQLEISDDLRVQLTSMRGLPLAEAECYIILAQIARVEGRLTDATLLTVLKALESFIVRSPITNIPYDVVIATLDAAAVQLMPAEPQTAEVIAENFVYSLFYERERLTTTLQNFSTCLSTASYPDLAVWEYMLRSLEVKSSRKEVAFEDTGLVHCLPSATTLQDHPEWTAFLKSQGNENPAALVHAYYDTLANFMLLENSIEYEDRFSEDPLAGLQKSRFNLTKGFKKLSPINSETMAERLSKMVRVCEKLWEFPKVSMKCATRNQPSNWFGLTQIASTRGTKVIGIRVGDISYTGSAYKMLAKTWKQAAWLIVKSLYECSTIQFGTERVAAMLRDPQLQIDGQSIFVSRAQANAELAEATAEFTIPAQYVQVTEDCNMLLLNSSDKVVKMLTLICRHLGCLDQVKIQLQ